MPEMRAALTTASAGGNTRFSTSTDSMALMGCLLGLTELRGNVRVTTYNALTGIKASKRKGGASQRGHPPCLHAHLQSRIFDASTPCLTPPSPDKISPLRPLPNLIFASRWLQLPLYLGLILAQAVYVVHFLVELEHLIEAAFGSQTALQALVTSIGYKTMSRSPR
jgi:hypothetical protein